MTDPSPPVAKLVPFVHTEHGVERPDPWHWIKDREDPDTVALLEAENAYNEAMTAHTTGLRKALYDEMLARIQEDDSSVPVLDGGWWTYSRTEEGKPYAIHCRKHGDLDADEQIVLDENALAEGHKYFRLEAMAIAPDHSRVAWLQDLDGAERFTLHVKDLRTGQVELIAEGLKWSLTWAADSRTLFATRADHAQRPHQVWRFDANGEHEPVMVLEEPDERFFVGVDHTRDRAFVLLEIGSKITSEIHLVDGHAPASAPRVVWPRREDVLYDVVHHTGTLYVRTNDAGRNFRAVSVPAAEPSAKPVEVRPHDPDVYLTGLQSFRDHLVFWERRECLPAVRIRTLSTGAEHQVAFPEAAYDVSPEQNPSFESHELRLTYMSPKTPKTVLVFDMDDHERAVLKVWPVIGYDARNYEVERLWATAPDGERIPISMLRRKDQTPATGRHPLYLIGYGSYGLSYPASFRSTRMSLVDRGVIVAIAHIRGGAERGRTWYEDGKFEHKTNTFTDFIAAAEHLIVEGWTKPSTLAIQGGSAGGLLMGAVMNMRPDLFGAVVANVPFVDALNTMFDDKLPLTVTEYDEWGDPNDREVFDRMRAYAPYENVAAVAYPHMYVTAGLNDPRVGYWEPAKWVQKLRATSTGDRPILFKVHLGAGHGGQSGRYGGLEDLAWEYAFVLDRLGAT